MEPVLTIFHHIHHEEDDHKVHHCGGDHPDVDYTVEHCSCGLHRIDKQRAEGHDFEGELISAEFKEECPDGGWHIESGVIEK